MKYERYKFQAPAAMSGNPGLVIRDTHTFFELAESECWIGPDLVAKLNRNDDLEGYVTKMGILMDQVDEFIKDNPDDFGGYPREIFEAIRKLIPGEMDVQT
jgi:hypothetical protein